MNDRGVSEVLGFVLVFAIVTATIGIVFASGFGSLAAVQQAEQLENMERAFDVLDDNLADLHRRDAPSRATELKLAGGSVGTQEPVELTIYSVNTSNASRNETFRTSSNPLVYDNGEGSKIVYSLGAILRTDNGNSAMLSEPSWFNDSAHAVFPLISTYPRSGNEHLGGNTKLLVVARRDTTATNVFSVNGPADVRVNITVESPRADAWNRFLAERGFVGIDTDPSDGNVTYQFFTDAIYAPRTSIEIDIER